MLNSVRKAIAESREVCRQYHSSQIRPAIMSLKQELVERDLLYQVTDEAAIDRLSSGGEVVYFGIDPTADSLHSGHLKPISCLAHILRHGNRGVLLLGGATARIGDPSGRESERAILPIETIRRNSEALAQALRKIFSSLGVSDQVTFVNNEEWYDDLNLLDFFAQVGPSLRLSVMLGKDSVKRRLKLPDGLNFQEFSYQAFQAYDFLQLHRRYGCTAQLGGADQWGNITAGCGIVRKITGCAAYGLTTGLLVDSKGNKLGKSLGGHPASTLWLSSSRTAPYTLYQSFLRLQDATCLQLMKQLLPHSLQELRQIDRDHIANPEERYGQKRLASEVVRIVHGGEELRKAELATRIAYYDPSHLNEMGDEEISQLLSAIPHIKLSLQENTDVPWTELLIRMDRTSPLENALSFVSQGLKINGSKVESEEVFRPERHLLKGNLSLVMIGRQVTFIQWQK